MWSPEEDAHGMIELSVNAGFKHEQRCLMRQRYGEGSHGFHHQVEVLPCESQLPWELSIAMFDFD